MRGGRDRHGQQADGQHGWEVVPPGDHVAFVAHCRSPQARPNNTGMRIRPLLSAPPWDGLIAPPVPSESTVTRFLASAAPAVLVRALAAFRCAGPAGRQRPRCRTCTGAPSSDVPRRPRAGGDRRAGRAGALLFRRGELAGCGRRSTPVAPGPPISTRGAERIGRRAGGGRSSTRRVIYLGNRRRRTSAPTSRKASARSSRPTAVQDLAVRVGLKNWLRRS